MVIDYLFSSPEGDIRLTPEDLARPFLLSPSQPHPFLTVRHYVEAIRTFLLRDEAACLMDVLMTRGIGKDGRNRIKRLGIRSEKHGALYHVASIEIFVDDRPIKLAVSTALSNEARSCLTNEYGILESLHRSLRLPYLPRVYKKGDVVCEDGNQAYETLTLMVSEWFEGFHEWHLSRDEADGCQKVCIWDLENGYRYKPEEEAFLIFRQASRILTLCYDVHSFKQIHPWRHAAGDFVVKTGHDGIHVKLTTARNYRSIMDFFSEGPVDPMIALVYFFLNLTIRMRLDRLNGVGETAWAGDVSVQAATEGFFDGLRTMVGKGTLTSGEIQNLLSLLGSLNQDEFERLFTPLLAFYEAEDSPSELSVILAHLKDHVRSLRQSLLKCRL